jgi:glutamyl-tRNA reductase
MPDWLMVGWSHHQTPIELRERLAMSADQAAELLGLLSKSLPRVEMVLLSTCNRVELYCAAEGDLPSSHQLLQSIADFRKLDLKTIKTTAVQQTELQVVQHLFRVASSLDSMVLGEAQILAQVRAAYEQACQLDTASSLMHRLFQRATAVARRVANETEIQRRRVSVPSVAVSEIATQFFEKFDDTQILLIGAGEMGIETLRYLQDGGANLISIINRNFERASEVAKQFGLKAFPWESIQQLIAQADLVVSTTSSPEPIVTREMFRQVRSRANQAVLILDLAVPRDFEQSIADFPDVYLYSVDDLQQVCQRNLQARQSQWPKATRIVDEETERFANESIHSGSAPTIKRLREQAEQIKKEELKRLKDKLQAHQLSPEVEQEVDYAFQRLVNKLLHPPLKSLRETADTTHHASLLDALRRLFQLKE